MITPFNTTTRRFAFAATLAVLTGVTLGLPRSSDACPQCNSAFKPGTYTGEAKRIGNGVAYSWVTLDAKGKPASVGVTLTESALEGLNDVAPTSIKEMERDMFMLMLPKEGMKTAFDHISLDWNPKGHDPSGIYDKPHFDVHFYAMTLSERQKIAGVGKDVAVCHKPVVNGFLPAGYVYAPGAEAPMMGGHWINTKSPELNGQPFTTTFIYGSYNGKVNFVEPMVTREFLLSRPQMEEAIALPTAYAKSAYYPTRYTVRYDATRHEYTIALEGMTWREAAVKSNTKLAATKPTTARRAAKGSK